MASGDESSGALYRPSGKPGRGIVALPFGIFTAALLSIVYGYVCVYNPIAGYISFLIPLGYGALLGTVMCSINRTTRCRSVALAGGVGVLCGLAAVYLGWAGFLYAIIHHSFPAALASKTSLWSIYSNPTLIWTLASSINSSGWFTVKGSTPSGIVLWIFWGIEALTIVWTTMYFASDWIKDTVFCEGCLLWSTKTDNIARFALTADPQSLEAFKSGDLTPLAKLAPAHSSDPMYLRVDAQRCAACRDTAGVSVVQVVTKKDEKGNDKVETKMLAKLVLMNQDLLDGFQAAAAQSAQAVKEQDSALAATKEERMKAGQLDEHERRESMRMALAAVDPEIKKQKNAFDKPTGAGCLWSIIGGVGCLVAGIALGGTSVGVALMVVTGLVCAAAGIYSIVMLNTSQKRFVKREIQPRLVLTLQPLKPTREELDATFSEAKELGYAAPTFLDAEKLYADIQSGKPQT